MSHGAVSSKKHEVGTEEEVCIIQARGKASRPGMDPGTLEVVVGTERP